MDTRQSDRLTSGISKAVRRLSLVAGIVASLIVALFSLFSTMASHPRYSTVESFIDIGIGTFFVMGLIFVSAWGAMRLIGWAVSGFKVTDEDHQ